MYLSLVLSVNLSADRPHRRGPDHGGSSTAAEVFGSRPFHLELAWSAALGRGYSGVSHETDRLFTMFADDESNFLIAMDSSTGEVHWRYRIGEGFAARGGSGGGPASTPAVADGAVYGLGPRGELFALDQEDGAEIWSMDIEEVFGARAPYYGFATSPIVVGDLLFLQAGGSEGRSLVGLDRKTGNLRWANSDDSIAYQSPILATLAGRRQIVAVTEERILGLDPDSGRILWARAHEVSGPEGASTAVPLGPDRLLLAGNRNVAMFRVEKRDDEFAIREVWRNRELKRSFATPVVHGEFIFGFSEEFLTCLSVSDGSKQWRSRRPGGHGLIRIGNHLAISAAGGSLVVADASREGYHERARLKVLDRASYTYPGFAQGTILLRDTQRIAAVRVHSGEAPSTDERTDATPDTEFAAFVRSVEQSDDKRKRIDEFMAARKSFPVVEDERFVHFVYRGDAKDVAVAGSMIEVHANSPLRQIEGTDFFYKTFAIEPGVRWEYRFIIDFDDGRPDPLNPRRARIGGDRASGLVMPGWTAPLHVEPYRGTHAGRIDEFVHNSDVLGAQRKVKIYLPHGYDQNGSRDYPLLMLIDGATWFGVGGMPNSLNHLLEGRMAPVIAAFVEIPPDAIPDELAGNRSGDYIRMLADELLPLLDRRYRTRKEPASRAVIGAALGALMSVHAAIERPDVFGNAGGISVQLIEPLGTRLIDAIESAKGERRARFHVLWNRYELRSNAADFDLGRDSRRLLRTLETTGFDVTGRELPDASGWVSWSAHVGEILVDIFPAPR